MRGSDPGQRFRSRPGVHDDTACTKLTEEVQVLPHTHTHRTVLCQNRQRRSTPGHAVSVDEVACPGQVHVQVYAGLDTCARTLRATPVVTSRQAAGRQRNGCEKARK